MVEYYSPLFSFNSSPRHLAYKVNPVGFLDLELDQVGFDEIPH